MLVNISSPMKRDEIKALLEANENPKCQDEDSDGNAV